MRIGYDLLVGKTTLSRWTVIDIEEFSRVQVFDHDKQQTRTISVHDEEDIFAVLDNGINKPETQDEEGRFDVFGSEDDVHNIRWENGTKVKFKAEYKKGSIEITGFIIRNFWRQYYLISEVGVSVPNRHWKVSHCLCERV